MRLELRFIAPIAFGPARRLEHRDLIEQLAAPDRILDEMHVRAAPHDDIVESGMLGQFLDRNRAAIGDIGKRAGRPVVRDELPRR